MCICLLCGFIQCVKCACVFNAQIYADNLHLNFKNSKLDHAEK